MKTKGIISLPFLAIIAFVIFGVGIWATYYAKSHKQNEEVVQIPISHEEATTTDQSLKDWETYQNNKFGIEFKYPKNWKQSTIFSSLGYANSVVFVESSREADLKKSIIPDNDNGIVVIQGSALFITPIKDEPFLAYLEKNNTLAKTSEIMIGGKKALYILYTAETDPNKFGGGSTEMYVFKEQGFIVEAHYPNIRPEGQLKTMLDQILGTFKFTN